MAGTVAVVMAEELPEMIRSASDEVLLVEVERDDVDEEEGSLSSSCCCVCSSDEFVFWRLLCGGRIIISSADKVGWLLEV